MNKNNKAYLITDFGAIPDSNELQTEKIQKAIDGCFLDGDERLLSRRVFI